MSFSDRGSLSFSPGYSLSEQMFNACKVGIRAFHLPHQGAMRLHELVSRKHLAPFTHTHMHTHTAASYYYPHLLGLLEWKFHKLFLALPPGNSHRICFLPIIQLAASNSPVQSQKAGVRNSGNDGSEGKVSWASLTLR